MSLIKSDFNLYICYSIFYTGFLCCSIQVKETSHNTEKVWEYICAPNMQKYFKSFLESKQPKTRDKSWATGDLLGHSHSFQCTGMQLKMPTPKHNFVQVKIQKAFVFQVSTDSKLYLLSNLWKINFNDHLGERTWMHLFSIRFQKVCRMQWKMRTSYPAEYTETGRVR